MTVLLDTPYIVPHGQREVGADFKASPNFHLRGGDLGSGLTAHGLVTVPPGRTNQLRVTGRIEGGDHLDPNSADWTVSQVRGFHMWHTDHVLFDHLEIEDFPLEAILYAGCCDVELKNVHAKHTSSLLNAHYFSGPMPRISQGLHVHDHCTFTDGRSDKSGEWKSVLDSRFAFGTSAINVVAADVEINGLVAVGEYKGLVKIADGRTIRVAYCHGNGIMVQGSCYWDPVKGANSTLPDGTPLFWPFGPASYARNVTIQGNVLHPRLSLNRFFDHPSFGGNTLQISYPQEGTRIYDNHLWWEILPTQPHLAFACIQLYQTGYEVAIRGNHFHQVPTPIHEHAIHMGDSTQAKDPSLRNADWRAANHFSVE